MFIYNHLNRSLLRILESTVGLLNNAKQTAHIVALLIIPVSVRPSNPRVLILCRQYIEHRIYPYNYVDSLWFTLDGARLGGLWFWVIIIWVERCRRPSSAGYNSTIIQTNSHLLYVNQFYFYLYSRPACLNERVVFFILPS